MFRCMARRSTEADFWLKTEQGGNGCVEWQAARNKAGYGICMFHGRAWLAHRLAFSLTRGDVPPMLDHLCRNRACVNPEHLEPVTHLQNVLRGLAGRVSNPGLPPRDLAAGGKGVQWAKKTHCPRGHEYDAENTYTNKRSGRICRRCRNMARDSRRKKA